MKLGTSLVTHGSVLVPQAWKPSVKGQKAVLSGFYGGFITEAW